MSSNKKMKPSNVIMDCIIGGVVLVLVFVLGTSFLGKKQDNANDTKQKKTETAQESVKKEENTEQYNCVIASGENNDTVFSITFHSDRMTYEESMSAGGQSSMLDKGTYVIEDGKYITTSTKTQKENTYVKDGEYLIVENEMYKGKLPDGEAVDTELVYEIEGEVKNTLTLKKDGTYKETILSYASEDTGSTDSEKTNTGTYVREGNFIKRTADDGGTLLDFYIYNDRISNAYYKIAE